MLPYIIEAICGLLSGIVFGITGFAPTGLILILFEALHIGTYKSTLGAILFINLFPLSIGSIREFYRAGQLDFRMGIIMLITTILGAYLGSKLVVSKDLGWQLSVRDIKLITSALGFLIGIVFLWAAMER